MEFTIWYSSDSMANFVIDNTDLSNYKTTKKRLAESDASKPKDFHKVPDHLKQILYLDCPDIIVELDGDPIFSLEDSKEAGTGHNAFQRFARLAASAENNIPSFYIYPEAVVIHRSSSSTYKWDSLNPLIYKALNRLTDLYESPSLLYYYPSEYRNKKDATASVLKKLNNKGLKHNPNIVDYPGCPSIDSSMSSMFIAINNLIRFVKDKGVKDGIISFSKSRCVSDQRDLLNADYAAKIESRDYKDLSPASSCLKVPTQSIIDFIKKKTNIDVLDSILLKRDETYIYKIDAKFRGDPYPGALAALDYLLCREGDTFEDRKFNLVLAWGKVSYYNGLLTVENTKGEGQSINAFVKDVKSCENKNLLSKEYNQIEPKYLPRYFMQVRYGSMFSKSKHIRIYAYFSDAILFYDGVLWRDG